MSKWYRAMAAGVGVLALAACSDVLDVENQNAADAERALARPSDVEALISGSYNTFHRTTLGANNLQPQMLVLGMESYSALANNNMSVRSSIPRPPIVNQRGAPLVGDIYTPYLNMHRAARAAALGLSKVNATGFTFFPSSATQIERAKAFAHFTMGVALGNVAMSFDSGNAVSDADDLTNNTPLPFLNYDALSVYALDRLDSAIAHAGAMGSQTIPTTWLATPTALSSAQFVALARGWKARIRAGTARDPVERAAVNWPAVLADAQAFVAAFPADWIQALNPSLGWDNAWLTLLYNNNSVNWHQMWGYMAYMAAGQTQYEAWLQTPPDLRLPFTMVTADQRWPQGASRVEQRCRTGALTGTACTGVPTTPTAFQYVQNRTTDWAGDPSANSEYRHLRFLALFNASRIGNFPSMTTAEMNLLQAEAQYQAGNYAAAAALVDLTRIARGGLPGLVANGVTNATTLVPGGASCVPRIPVGPSFTTTACGNLLEALKWEYRMEVQFTQWNAWWTTARGWGDMPAGTPVHFPVPLAEMDTRIQASYDMAGPTSNPGTYGI